MSKKVVAIFEQALNYTAYLSSALIAFVFAIITLSVLLRFLFNISILWPQEVTEYILATVTFVGAAWVLKKERHVFIDIALGLFTTRGQTIINTITSFVATILCFVLLYYGILATWDHFQRGTHMAMKAMGLPTAPLLSVLPIGFFLLSIQFVRRTLRYLKLWRTPPEKKAKKTEDLSEF